IGIEEVADQEAGVWFVDFSSLREPSRIAQAVGQSLGLHESASMGMAEAIVDFVGTSGRLLIFDNCEHLSEGCAKVAAELLSHCPNLRIVATSRVPLSINGEHRFNVPSLLLPE